MTKLVIFDLDGVLVASNTAAAPNATLDSKIYFGTYHGHSSADHIHDGPIGDGRFYKGVLTAEQVVQNYLATKNKYPTGHHATLVGSPTWGTYNSGGVTYNYFDLNGSSQYMTIPHNTIFDFELPTTLEIWANKDGTGREWLIENGFQGKENQKVPKMTDEIVNDISKRYIELYENIIGEKFKKRKTENMLNDIESNIKIVL